VTAAGDVEKPIHRKDGDASASPSRRKMIAER
jgi:hypothetical protein